MKFTIRLTDSALEDLDYFRKNERQIISEAVSQSLGDDADVESKRRKPLRPNPLAAWELRIGDYRVFYNVEGTDVNVVAVGHKEHSDLYIRGTKVDL